MGCGPNPGRISLWVVLLGVLLGLWGCMVSKGQLNTCQTQNRALTEKNAALQSEVENLRTNRDHLLRKLQQTEEELALVRQENEVVRRRLELKETASGETDASYISGQAALSPQSRLRLDQLAKRFPSLGLNSTTGQCQLASERLFPPGQAQLKSDAQSWLDSLRQLLQSSEGRDLRVWIVARSHEESSQTRSGQGGSASSTLLAAQQAQVLQQQLRHMGIESSRVGVAAVAALPSSQASTGPASTASASWVEVFLLPPDVPIVGWAAQGRVY